MAKNKTKVDLETTLSDGASGAKPYKGLGHGAMTDPTQTTMTADEVQQTVSQAQAAGGLPTEGWQVGGWLPNGGYGTGAWRQLVNPGGKTVSNMQALMAMAPGAYQSQYQGAMAGLMNELLQQKPFSYDVNADGLYQQIKDSYTKAGRQAMMDTAGQSAALTGGYGNSYGVTAGNQAYQESLGNLAGAIPELQQLAYSQYQQDLDNKRMNLEALNKLDEQAYARWADDAAAYQQLLEKLPANGTGAGGGGGYSYNGSDIKSPYQTTAGETPMDMGTYSTFYEYFLANPQAAYDAMTYMNTGGSFKGYNNSDVEKAAMAALTGSWTTPDKMEVPGSGTGQSTSQETGPEAWWKKKNPQAAQD